MIVPAEPLDEAPAKTPRPDPATATDPLQWLRELMAVTISAAVLCLTVVMMWMTFNSAGATEFVRVQQISGTGSASAPAPTPEAIKEARTYQTEAYNRQKDIMLYALALLGTVTGYYLGRVPAEINAKRAENAAVTAQGQLTRTQEQLASSAGSVAKAQTELGHVKEQKAKAANRVRSSTKALKDVRQALVDQDIVNRGSSDALGSRTSGSGPQLTVIIDRIDAALQDIESEPD
jgi:hypothetical protein